MDEVLKSVLSFIDENFEALAVIVIGAITLEYNRRSQVKLLQLNAKIKTSESLYSDITEIRKAISEVASSNDSIMRELANAGDTTLNPNESQSSKDTATRKHFDNISDTLERAYKTRGRILSLFESIETNTFTSNNIAPAIRALRLEYEELNESLRSVHDMAIHFDIKNPTPDRFKDLHTEFQKSNGRLFQFGQLLDDLVVIIQNNLIGKVFGTKRQYRYLDPPRRVLTEKGIVDHRVGST